LLESFIFQFLLFAFTHPVTILMILAFAKSRGYNALMCYLPIALLNFIVGVISLGMKFIQKAPEATRDSFTSMSAKHFTILGFVYTFGYMIPTIRLIQMLDKN
jgi:hypothetical protein